MSSVLHRHIILYYVLYIVESSGPSIEWEVAQSRYIAMNSNVGTIGVFLTNVRTFGMLLPWFVQTPRFYFQDQIGE